MSKEFHLLLAKKLAALLDDRFEIFGIKFGLDPVLDLIPGIGDILATVIGIYIIYVAALFRLPQRKINRMIINMILDFVIGLVPFLGPIGTIFFRSNRMNIQILEDHMRADIVEEGVIV